MNILPDQFYKIELWSNGTKVNIELYADSYKKCLELLDSVLKKRGLITYVKEYSQDQKTLITIY